MKNLSLKRLKQDKEVLINNIQSAKLQAERLMGALMYIEENIKLMEANNDNAKPDSKE